MQYGSMQYVVGGFEHSLYIPHTVMGNRWRQSGRGRHSDQWETREGKLPERRGELDYKIKQEATRQHRHKTKTKHNLNLPGHDIYGVILMLHSLILLWLHSILRKGKCSANGSLL